MPELPHSGIKTARAESEGDYDTLMEIVKNCQLVAAKAGCKAMNTYVKISYKAEGDVLTIDKKVTKHHQ